MGNLLASLQTTADSMAAVEKAIDTATNNVMNAKSAGFAKQRLPLLAKRFEIDSGLIGGAEAGDLVSSRLRYLERSVWDQAHGWGKYAQRESLLERLEPVFDIASGSGIAGALDRLFQSFSQWSVNPNDTPIRQTVIDRARDLAATFQYSAASLAEAREDIQNELASVLEKINRVGEQIRQFNLEIRQDVRTQWDAGLDAHIHTQLEELAEYVDFDVLRGDDGAYTVNLGGQTPLVMGERFHPISADFSSGQAVILDFRGQDVTSQFQQGRLFSLVDVHNNFVPGVMQDLDLLAQSLADDINSALQSGLDRNGLPPAVDLFTYNTTTGPAASLSITAILPNELAGAIATAPGGNGNALNLAALATSKQVNDFTYTQYYGFVAGRAGRELANARKDEYSQSLLLAQARNLRAEKTEVSLDEEAANLIVFQRQYQANAEMVRILNELTGTVIDLIR